MTATTRSRSVGKRKIPFPVVAGTRRPCASPKKRRSNPRASSDQSEPSPKPKSSVSKSPKGECNEAILTALHILLSDSETNSTICPSEVPRRLHKEDSKAYPDWRGMMVEVRDIVWREVEAGRVEVTQGGESRRLEERESIRGPIRVRRGPNWTD